LVHSEAQPSASYTALLNAPVNNADARGLYAVASVGQAFAAPMGLPFVWREDVQSGLRLSSEASYAQRVTALKTMMLKGDTTMCNSGWDPVVGIDSSYVKAWVIGGPCCEKLSITCWFAYAGLTWNGWEQGASTLAGELLGHDESKVSTLPRQSGSSGLWFSELVHWDVRSAEMDLRLGQVELLYFLHPTIAMNPRNLTSMAYVGGGFAEAMYAGCSIRAAGGCD
jgi:hypothetical protein